MNCNIILNSFINRNLRLCSLASMCRYSNFSFRGSSITPFCVYGENFDLQRNNDIFTNVSSSFYVTKRYKNKKSKKSEDSDSDDDNDVSADAGDKSLNKDSKVITAKVTSMRVDAILKAAIKISRSKIEKLFYESRLRINGNSVMKKSAHVNIGDEIDVVKEQSPSNPDFLVVSRVEIMDVSASEDALSLKCRYFKTYLIENYEKPWTPDAKPDFVKKEAKDT